MKRGDWVKIGPKVNHWGDRTGRIAAVNEDGLAGVTEYGVIFETGGVVAWFVAEELALTTKKQGSHNIPLPTLKKLRAEHLVAGLR